MQLCLRALLKSFRFRFDKSPLNLVIGLAEVLSYDACPEQTLHPRLQLLPAALVSLPPIECRQSSRLGPRGQRAPSETFRAAIQRQAGWLSIPARTRGALSLESRILACSSLSLADRLSICIASSLDWCDQYLCGCVSDTRAYAIFMHSVQAFMVFTKVARWFCDACVICLGLESQCKSRRTACSIHSSAFIRKLGSGAGFPSSNDVRKAGARVSTGLTAQMSKLQLGSVLAWYSQLFAGPAQTMIGVPTVCILSLSWKSIVCFSSAAKS